MRNTQGGLTRKHPLWKRWESMHDRCKNPKNKDWEGYGGRGITVCARWKNFPAFIADVEATFFEGATLERVDNNGNYEPGNVRWAINLEQHWNMRNTVFLDTPWGRMSRGEAAFRAGVPTERFIARMRHGWSAERLFDPANRKKCNRWDKSSKK